MLLEYKVDDCVGKRDGRSVYPDLVSSYVLHDIMDRQTDDSNILVFGQLSGNRRFTVAASLCGKVHDYRARFHCRDHLTSE